MADFTNWLENSALNAVLGASSLAATTSLTISLHTGDPGEDAVANEVIGGSYARQTITFGAPSTKIVLNTNSITFSGMPATTVTHFAVWDQASNPWFKGDVNPDETVSAGGDFDIAVGDVDITISGGLSTFAAHGILNAFRGNAAFQAAFVKVTLATGDPGDGAMVNQVPGLTRQTVTWNTITNGSTTNSADITFPTVTSATVTWAALIEDDAGNDVLWKVTVTSVTDTDFRIKSGQMSVTLT